MASSPFARLLEPDDTEADKVVAIARRPARGPPRDGAPSAGPDRPLGAADGGVLPG
jgi:hypothetical protein